MYTDIDQLYRETILDLYRNPLNKKALAVFDVQSRAYNPLCGDDITVQIKFDKEGRAADIGHQGTGCAISQAAVSLVTEEIKGRDTEAIRQLDNSFVYELLGFEPVYTRVNCASLGLKAIINALM